jgi:dihydroflavonol-4-reductase
MRYLVTGSDGHLGGTIVSLLVEQGFPVRGLRLPDSTLKTPVKEEVCYGDVTKPETLDCFFADSEGSVVIHTAGIVSITSSFSQKMWDVNVEGTRNIVEACKKHHVGRLIYVSSVHALKGDNEEEIHDSKSCTAPYEQSKAAATRIVLDAATSISVNVVYPSGILGPGDYGNGHLTALLRDYLSGNLTSLVHGGYDIVDVRDVANGIILVSSKAKAGECFILSGGYHEISEVLDIASSVSGKKKVTRFLPSWFATFTAPLAELYYRIRKKPMLYSRYALATLKNGKGFSSEKAERELGYIHRPIAETVRDTIASF